MPLGLEETKLECLSAILDIVFIKGNPVNATAIVLLM
jgi:hypothetical protein